ncbi:hypothetical protein [Micromonospora sp. NPDC050276]|uniref:hypothetical protein n=1 Tax=Micromonospora sp. NPDC050276 TaxID=3364278 RepID=UPI0037A41C66
MVLDGDVRQPTQGSTSLPPLGEPGRLTLPFGPAGVVYLLPAYVITAGLLIAAIGFGLTNFLSPTSSPALIAASLALVSLGAGMGLALSNDIIMSSVKPERAGQAAATSETAYEIGTTLGTAVLGGILVAWYTRVVTAGTVPRQDASGIRSRDVFATATSVAGGEYGLNQVDADDPGATPPDYTASQAWSQMGERARQMPLLVMQGEEDGLVPPIVATRLVEHWTAISDLVGDGLLNESLDLVAETTTVPAELGRHAYTHTTITTPDGTSVVESYLVHDMGHVWPGPAGDGLFTDRAGPDASAIVWDFARRHPKGSPETGR